MIYTFFFYTLFSSALLLYGVGLNSATIVCDSLRDLVLPLIKIVSSVFGSAVLTWLIIKHILVSLHLVSLYPLIAILIFFTLSVFLEVLIRITTGTITSEYNFSFLITLLALNESSSITELLMIAASCLLSFILVLPLFYSLKNRIDLIGNNQVHGNRKCLLLISIAMIIIAISFGNVSWLNSGVLK